MNDPAKPPVAMCEQCKSHPVSMAGLCEPCIRRIEDMIPGVPINRRECRACNGTGFQPETVFCEACGGFGYRR